MSHTPANLALTQNSLSITLVRPLINVEKNSPFFIPLGLLCLGSSLKRSGHHVRVIDYEHLYRTDKYDPRGKNYVERLCEPVLAQAPDVIGITVLSDTLPLALLMGKQLKALSPDTPVVFGGPGVFGVLPILLERFPECVDYVCVGEGEEAFTDLVNQVAAGNEWPHVPGMVGRVRGEVVDFGHRELADIDQLPPPAYDLIPVPEYIEIASPRIFDLHVGSGCTYACKFCTTAPFWSRKFRAKAPEAILAELDALFRDYGITQVNFLHDNFANARPYLDKFVEYFISHNTRYEWACAVRPDNVDSDQLARMKRAGCFRLFCGIDSGSTKILRQMSKLPNTRASYNFFRNCWTQGVEFETNTIIGYPGEGESELEESLMLIFDSIAFGAAASDVSVLQPLPGAAVTVENEQYLEFPETQQYGGFLPSEVLSMAQADRRLFSGFWFIRKNNRKFEYYTAIVPLIRFFTRHFFRLIYFLKHACKLSYVQLFESLTQAQSADEYRDRLVNYVQSSSFGEEFDAVKDALLAYEDAIFSLKAVDVVSEIENVYTRPEQKAPGFSYRLLELDYEVHALFAQPPTTCPAKFERRRTYYLLYRDAARNVITAQMAEWQRTCWVQLEVDGLKEMSDKYIDNCAKALVKASGANWERARTAVTSVITLFRSLNI